MAKKEKVTTMFLFKTPEGAVEFYERRDRMGIRTPESAHRLLMQMAKEGKVDRVIQTSRTPEKIIEDYRQHGFNIIDHRHLSLWKRFKRWLRKKGRHILNG